MVSIAGSLVSKHRNHGFLFPGMLVSEGPDTGVTSPGILTFLIVVAYLRIILVLFAIFRMFFGSKRLETYKAVFATLFATLN